MFNGVVVDRGDEMTFRRRLNYPSRSRVLARYASRTSYAQLMAGT